MKTLDEAINSMGGRLQDVQDIKTARLNFREFVGRYESLIAEFADSEAVRADITVILLILVEQFSEQHQGCVNDDEHFEKLVRSIAMSFYARGILVGIEMEKQGG